MSNESLDRFAAQKLESLARRNLRRELGGHRSLGRAPRREPQRALSRG
jgi:hypothetical protein